GCQPVPGAFDGLAIATQYPTSLLGRRLIEERRDVVARRAYADVIPIDEPGARAVAGQGDEDVLRPEIAVQQRIGPSSLVHEADTIGRLFEQPVQSLEQMATGLGKLRRANGRERLERANAVAEVRDQRSPAMIAGEPADLGQEGVARASCVELGDEIDRRLQTRALAPISERLGTEVLVHVPHPAPFSLRRTRGPPRREGAGQSLARRAGLAHAMREHAWAPAIDSRCPRAARSAAVSRYEASSCDASGTPPHPGMLHISTTYGFPSLSMMSTL